MPPTVRSTVPSKIKEFPDTILELNLLKSNLKIKIKNRKANKLKQKINKWPDSHHF